VVKKRRRKGKVADIKTEVVFGEENKVMEAIERSPVSNQITTPSLSETILR